MDFQFSPEINGRLPNPFVLPFIHYAAIAEAATAAVAVAAVIPHVCRLIKGIVDSFIPKQRLCIRFRFKHYFDIEFKSGVHSCERIVEQMGYLQLKSVFTFLRL